MKHYIKFSGLLLLFSIQITSAISQGYYFVRFTDKSNSPYSVSSPEEFLSERAISRRNMYNIPVEENDLPVNQRYLDSLRNIGVTVLTSSRWFNAATCKVTGSKIFEKLNLFEFVESMEKTKPLSAKRCDTEISKFGISSDSIMVLDYGSAENQVQMLNGHVLHNLGYRGEGIQIAIIDGGFYAVNRYPAFDSLWANDRIIGTKDFVDGGEVSFSGSSHGMKVLSTIGGNQPGYIIGTAPDASFWLLRTEDVSSEYRMEEDNWIAAAEFADSVGVDIISTSLGYSEFTNTLQNYTYADMDGNTARITIAADIAASKGILVVSSAGNAGNEEWRYITAPADADSVLTVGAVNYSGSYMAFSSIGPTYDNRIKPNVVAKGYHTTVQSLSGAISEENGTSFSAPLIAGMAACLWQVYPELSNIELIDIIERSADQYLSPDCYRGYGLPDFAAMLKSLQLNETCKNNIFAYPNPFSSSITVEVFTEDDNINVKLIDLNGKVIRTASRSASLESFFTIEFTGLQDLLQGIYFIKTTGNNNLQLKVIKI